VLLNSIFQISACKELLAHLKDGYTTFDGAEIQGHEVQAINGVIHTVEIVMLKN